MKVFNESRLIDEANELMKEGKFNEAIKRFNYILHINPNSRGAIIGKEMAMGLRDTITIVKAMQIPEKAWDLVDMADMTEGKKAIKLLDKAISIAPKWDRAWGRKGDKLALMKKYDQAIICLDKALELNPRFSNAWIMKGLILKDTKKYEQAILCFDKALEFDPGDFDTENYRKETLELMRST